MCVWVCNIKYYFIFHCSITQVVELVDFMRTSCPVVRLERVVEVQHRQWTVALASSKHRHTPRDSQLLLESHLGVLPYIARPSHLQDTHTGNTLIAAHTHTVRSGGHTNTPVSLYYTYPCNVYSPTHTHTHTHTHTE